MNNEIVKHAPPVGELEAFASYYIDTIGLEPEQVSYIVLRENKIIVDNALKSKELEAQALLLKPGEKIEEIEETIKKYKKLYVDLVEEIRKPFTNFIKTNLSEPLMQYEVRINPADNEEFKKLSKKLIELKEVDAKNKADVARKLQEKANFLAHIKNETNRVSTAYKTACLDEITKMYEFWLVNKIEAPEIDVLKSALKSIALPETVQMQRQFLGDEEAMNLYTEWLGKGEFFQLSIEELYEETVEYVDKKMLTYANDLEQVKAKPEIIEEIKQNDKKEIETIKEEAETQQSVNNLVSSSTKPTFLYTPSYKALSTVLSINLENTREFAVKVMTIFCANPDMEKYLAVKEWKNLKVEQMVSAIAKYAMDGGKKFPEFIYVETKK